MKYNLIETKEILDFEKELPVELVVNGRSKKSGLPLYYVAFEYTEVMEGGMLTSVAGNGETINEALRDYCLKISGERLAIFAYSKNRKEIVCPKLVHTLHISYLAGLKEREPMKSELQQLTDKVNRIELIVQNHTNELYFAMTAEIGKDKEFKSKELLRGKVDRIERELNDLKNSSVNQFPHR